MATLIAGIIFISSLLGMGTILFQKVPLLIELPEVSDKEKKENLVLRLKKKIQRIRFFQNFSYERFLQKMLSKIRILILRTDNKTSLWLQKLREKSKKKKIIEEDNYWDEIKNSTNSKE